MKPLKILLFINYFYFPRLKTNPEDKFIFYTFRFTITTKIGVFLPCTNEKQNRHKLVARAIWHVSTLLRFAPCRRYMAEILPIRRKTL